MCIENVIYWDILPRVIYQDRYHSHISMLRNSWFTVNVGWPKASRCDYAQPRKCNNSTHNLTVLHVGFVCIKITRLHMNVYTLLVAYYKLVIYYHFSILCTHLRCEWYRSFHQTPNNNANKWQNVIFSQLLQAALRIINDLNFSNLTTLEFGETVLDNCW